MGYIKLYEEIEAYHGSVLKFDKFDTNKLSRKLGNDTYGWGLYFTNSEEIAKVYTDEHNDKYIYRVKLHKGKNVDDYDYLIFKEKPTKTQFSKIESQLKKQIIDLDLSKVNTSWELISLFIDYYYDNFDIDTQMSYGQNTAKKYTSKFLLSCGIDGMRYTAGDNFEGGYEYGLDGYNYVVFDDDSVTIEDVKKLG